MTSYNVFILIIIILFIADQSVYRKRFGYFCYLAISITILFTILRDSVGYDYSTYVELFTMPAKRLLERGLEPGFIGLTGFIQLYSDNYFWLFFIFGISIILLICHGIKLYTTNFRIAFIIYILTPGLFLNSFSILRQSLAIALLFNFFYYYYYKKNNIALFYFLTAVLFHYTVLVALPFFYIAKKITRSAKIYIIIGIPFSLFLSKINIIPTLIELILGDTKFIAYANFNDDGTSFSKLLILNLVFIAYLLFYKKLNPLNKTLLVIVSTGLMLTNICADVAAITRIGYYFKIFDCVLIANIIKFIKNPYARVGVVIFIFLYFYTLFLNALNVDLNLTYYPKLTPYKTFFD